MQQTLFGGNNKRDERLPRKISEVNYTCIRFIQAVKYIMKLCIVCMMIQLIAFLCVLPCLSGFHEEEKQLVDACFVITKADINWCSNLLLCWVFL
jgi:hypothetical protein